MATDDERLRRWHSVALLFCTLACAACSVAYPETSALFVAKTPTIALTATGPVVESTRWTALLKGTLENEGPCIEVTSPEGHETHTLAWPADFHYEFDGTTLIVQDIPLGEARTWKIGEIVEIGGGELMVLDESVRDSVPEECIGPYWVFGSWARR